MLCPMSPHPHPFPPFSPLISQPPSHPFDAPHAQQMRPEEKVFFKSPVALAQKHLAHISQVRKTQVMGDEVPPLSATPQTDGVTPVPQVWHFQMTQAQLLVDLHRDRAQRVQAELEKAREELGERRR